MNVNITSQVKSYYQDKINEFGSTALGVDWSSESSQFQRFERLLKYMPLKENDSILDFGCGYGALLDYLKSRNIFSNYTGLDLVSEMLEVAASRNPEVAINFISELPPNRTWDYVTMSGVFNVKGDVKIDEWEVYLTETLNSVIQLATKGISFNLLTSFNDLNRRKDHLYYCDPREIALKINLESPFTLTIDHSYELWEFTVTILK
jgi:SAM-dependent methyltransferase